MTFPTPDSSRQGDEPWWASRRTVLAAGLVLGIVLLAVFLALRPGDNTPQAGEPAAPGWTSATSPQASGASSPDDMNVPREAPPARWDVYKTIALPVSPSAGPREVDHDMAVGYSHSPTGALIAATQLSVRYSLANDWRPVLDRSVAPGPGRDAWAATRSKYGSWATPTPGSYCQAAGFAFVDYQPSRAVIQLVHRCSGGQLQATVVTVAWQDEDWKLVLQPDGSSSPTQEPIESLDGYSPWGGV